MTDSKKPINFEKQINELEEIVKHMEEGSLSLEDSLKFFEDGIKITRACQQALKEAELKVEILTMGSGKLEAFESPKNFTYPPRGMAAICQTVPRLSFLEKSLGPIPTEKTSA